MSGIEQAFWLALLTVTFCALWSWHIRRHPWMPCGKCRGNGKAHHVLAPYGRCSRCGGKGERLRFAAKILGYNLDSGRKR